MSIRISQSQRNEMKRQRLRSQMIAAAHDLFELHPNEMERYGNQPEDIVPQLYQFADEVINCGLSDPELRSRLMILAFLKHPKPWPAFLELKVWQDIRQNPAQANTLFEDFCSKLKYLSVRGRLDLDVWW